MAIEGVARGEVRQQLGSGSLEARIPKDHPLRPVRAMDDRARESLSKDFARIDSVTGRPSIPPEQLLRAPLIQILNSVRSERQRVEPLEDDLLFRWFVGPVFTAAAYDVVGLRSSAFAT